MSNELHIAVLLNGYDSPYKPRIRESYERAIATATKSSTTSTTIDFFDPILEQRYPEAAQYDLIVLSGGTEDPMGDAPWVRRMQAYLRETVASQPKQKILGICWGHQTIAVTFGGIVGDMELAEVGVTDITLTEAGKQYFPFANNGHLRMHEFHKRDIKTPAEGFLRLAEQNQAFVNEANTVLSFQGHPELSADLATTMVDQMPSYMCIEGLQRDAMRIKVSLNHDGIDLWTRVLQWVKE